MLETSIPDSYRQDVSLSTVGYYGIGGQTRFLASPACIPELGRLLAWCVDRQVPVIVTGSGSNMLFSDEDFPGMVVTTGSMRRMFWISMHELFCEAGVENTDISLELLRQKRCGGEWLYRLPGKIGASVRMNARCYGREMSEVATGIVTVSVDGMIRWRDGSSVFRGYKHTSLMEVREVVAGVVLHFAGTGTETCIREEMDRYGRDREAKHQFDLPSCGSVFKNSRDAGRPSGQIFESLGFKGQQVGGARVSDHHANFIFNTGGATAADVLMLAARMKKAAKEHADADLELELQCAGRFDATLLDACGISAVPDPGLPGKAWAGLLWHPGSDTEAALPVYPRVLIAGPVFGYAGYEERFPARITVSVEQLSPLQEARLQPDSPFLRWATCDGTGGSFSLLPEDPPGSFVDGLWKWSVSELFIGAGDGTGAYLEFESTPAGHWIALRFDAARIRSEGDASPSEESWAGLVQGFSRQDGSFGMEYPYRIIEPFIRDGLLCLQCCVSLGDERYGIFPWWPAGGTPDFHQPGQFSAVRVV
jgi:UDP-N-acetylmuramate dehydrogenase